MRMKIGDLSERTGVPTRMLRYYETQGLLAPGRAGNGYRQYSEEDVHTVEMVRSLVRSGVPTRFIKIVLDKQSGAVDWGPRCDAVLSDMIREQIVDLDAKIACLSTSRAALAHLVGESVES